MDNYPEPTYDELKSNDLEIQSRDDDTQAHGVNDKVVCGRCKGTGVEWVMIGRDVPEPDKDVCSYCDGEGVIDVN